MKGDSRQKVVDLLGFRPTEVDGKQSGKSNEMIEGGMDRMKKTVGSRQRSMRQ
jgi:hypothetical protein